MKLARRSFLDRRGSGEITMAGVENDDAESVQLKISSIDVDDNKAISRIQPDR
jgi:hypothetical protein